MGVDYHFLPVSYFLDNLELVLVKQTNKGDYYGTKEADLHSDTHHLLLTLRFAGIRKLISLGLNDVAIMRISITENLESFYSQFKIELGDVGRFDSLGELTAAIYRQIYYYNTERIHTSLNMAPIAFARRYEVLLKA